MTPGRATTPRGHQIQGEKTLKRKLNQKAHMAHVPWL